MEVPRVQINELVGLKWKESTLTGWLFSCLNLSRIFIDLIYFLYILK